MPTMSTSAISRKARRTFVAGLLAAGLVVSLAAPASAQKKPPESQGFDGESITLGVVTPTTGIVSVIGKPLTAGNEMWWKYYNEEKGGIAGKYEVVLSEEDSQYKAEVGVQAYDRLKGDVAAFQQILGTQITKALLPKLQADKLGGAPATLDALWVHVPSLFPVGAPYQVEAINALDYYVKAQGKSKKVCALAQDDEFGTAGLEGYAAARKVLKFKKGPTPEFSTGSDVTAQIQELADANCDAVLVVATAADASAILTKSIALDFSPQMIGLAPFWLPSLAKSAQLQQFLVDHFWLAAEKAIAWGDTTIPGMQDFLDRAAKYAPEQAPDPYFIFGYLQGQAMAQILERAAKDGDLSPEGILTASTKVKKIKFDGLAGDYKYGPAPKRNPPRTTALFQVDPTGAVGLKLIEAELTSKAAKSYKIEGGG
jgi:ABC-type branched-subunit amino acid transport system substrate-binding protein